MRNKFWKTTVWENKEKHLEIILHLCIKNLGEIGLKLAILGHFLSCYPSKTPKNQNFEKMKKNAGDIILHICTKNHNHMMYDGIFSFWVIFCPFTSLKNPKIKILKKWKKPPGDIIIFHVYQKSWSYGVCFLRYRVPQTKDFAVLGHFLPLYPPNNSDNKNFEKMKKKKRLEILPFYTHKCTINKDQTIRQTDGRTD